MGLKCVVLCRAILNCRETHKCHTHTLAARVRPNFLGCKKSAATSWKSFRCTACLSQAVAEWTQVTHRGEELQNSLMSHGLKKKAHYASFLVPT